MGYTMGKILTKKGKERSILLWSEVKTLCLRVYLSRQQVDCGLGQKVWWSKPMQWTKRRTVLCEIVANKNCCLPKKDRKVECEIVAYKNWCLPKKEGKVECEIVAYKKLMPAKKGRKSWNCCLPRQQVVWGVGRAVSRAKAPVFNILLFSFLLLSKPLLWKYVPPFNEIFSPIIKIFALVINTFSPFMRMFATELLLKS